MCCCKFRIYLLTIICYNREERSDQTEDLKAESTELKGIVHKLREENKALSGDARSARSYRDELDIVKEKALKVDKLERQLQGYKDRMHELDFYKARVDVSMGA